MRNYLPSASLVFAFASLAIAADTPYWVEPCTNPATGCVAADVDLAKWAFQAWQDSSGGHLHFVPAEDRAHAVIRLVWASPSDGLYGETLRLLVNGRPGAQINVRIAAGDTKDRLLRDTIVYLTCLHESGHALGLDHTAEFADIMYSFQFGGDITEYFARYRRKLASRQDIQKNSGISPADHQHLLDTFR